LCWRPQGSVFTHFFSPTLLTFLVILSNPMTLHHYLSMTPRCIFPVQTSPKF
jgi:hypothetical protein